MCPVLWDITGLHYDRSTCKMIDQQLKSDFMNILESTMLRGDISGNGEIDLYDAIEIAKYIMGMVSFDSEQCEVADYDGNGTVDLYDAIGVARYIMGIT